MLHILNGDSTADTLRQTSLSGDHLVIRESLLEGPTPAGLSPLQWRSIRAAFLSISYDVSVGECERDLADQFERLGTAPENEEICFWFEHDLFCLLHYTYLLAHFSALDRSRTRLTAVFIGSFPERPNFRGLGELNPDQLVQVWSQRIDVTESQLQIGAKAWRAYTAPAPDELLALAKEDTSDLPFLADGLMLHLARFPSPVDGLGRIERLILELIGDDERSFVDLFTAFGQTAPAYGLGDSQFQLYLNRLADAPQPALSVQTSTDQSADPPAQPNLKATFALTDVGQALREGRQNFIDLNGIDHWLGGVHLRPDNLWLWDPARQVLQRRS